MSFGILEAMDPASPAKKLLTRTALGRDESGELVHRFLQLTNPAVCGANPDLTNRGLDRVLCAYPEEANLLREYLAAVVDVVVRAFEGQV